MEHDGCKGCKYENCSPESKECMGCKQNAVDKYTRMTQADRIRSMSEEELANILVQAIPCKICVYWSKEISSCNAPFGFICTKGYAAALIQKWLQSEVEE